MWHIGQDIVCIKIHSDGNVKEGQVYTINSLKKGCCCILIDIGLLDENKKCVCYCGNLMETNGYHWFAEKLFKPLDELSDISELMEVLELETV